MVAKDAEAQVAVDLPAQKLTLPNGKQVEFPVDEFSKHCLVEGVDELGYILKRDAAIREFEARHDPGINALVG